MTTFISSNNAAANANPKSGESSSDFPMLAACPQSTPLVPERADINWFAIPTPMIDPIKVCELDAGSPSHQVPRFQMIAAVNNAKTMANPALLPTCKMSSTGSKDTMPNATMPDEMTTPKKFQNPLQTTATCGSKEWV